MRTKQNRLHIVLLHFALTNFLRKVLKSLPGVVGVDVLNVLGDPFVRGVAGILVPLVHGVVVVAGLHELVDSKVRISKMSQHRLEENKSFLSSPTTMRAMNLPNFPRNIMKHKIKNKKKVQNIYKKKITVKFARPFPEKS